MPNKTLSFLGLLLLSVAIVSPAAMAQEKAADPKNGGLEAPKV